MTTLENYISNVEKGYPLTHYPKTVPEVQDKIVSRMTGCVYRDAPMVGIALGPEESQHAHGASLMFIQKYMDVFNEGLNVQLLIPNNALTVSYAILNFAVGKSCQEFYPKDRKMPDDAFFTYRMLSKHCQATYYNEGGVCHLAGICYYLQLKDSSLLTTTVDKFAMSDAVGSNIPYPLGDRWKSWRFTTHRQYGRDCKTAGKRVQVLLEEGKQPAHRWYDYRINNFVIADCQECREEAKTYKYGSLKNAGPTPEQIKYFERIRESWFRARMAREVMEVMPATVIPVVGLMQDLKEEPAPVIPKVDVKEDLKEKPATVTPDLKEEVESTIEEKLEQLEIIEFDDDLSPDDSDYVFV